MQIFTIDTLNFAIRNDINPFMILGIDIYNFDSSSKPEFNYKYAVYLQGIKVSLGGIKGYTSYVSISGKGCRTLEDLRGEEFDWFYFLCDLISYDVSIRRIDIACDDFSDTVTVSKAKKCLEQNKIAGSCRTFHCDFGNKIQCFYAGSPQSNVLLRIYNKALERGFLDGLKDGKPWIRVELQLRDEAATQIVNELCLINGSSDSLPFLFTGHILNHCRFLKEKNPGPHSDRITTATWWSKFLNNTNKIKFISSLGSDYNLSKLDSYLKKQAASSIKTYALAFNLTPEQLYNTFVNDDVKLNNNQIYALKNYA